LVTTGKHAVVREVSNMNVGKGTHKVFSDLNIILNIRFFFSKDQISSLNTENFVFLFFHSAFSCSDILNVVVFRSFVFLFVLLWKLFFLSLFRVQQLFLLAASYTSRYLLRCLVSCQFSSPAAVPLPWCNSFSSFRRMLPRRWFSPLMYRSVQPISRIFPTTAEPVWRWYRGLAHHRCSWQVHPPAVAFFGYSVAYVACWCGWRGAVQW